ncbi:glycosyltransferase [candidate division KSB1 bacterium]|nr:glycosyltransferase [candidate division KSB1 bacterium]
MKLICIGNFPPRECGIAAFTHDLYTSLQINARKIKTRFEMDIIAMNPPYKHFNYPDPVKYSINQQQQKEYIKAADYINNSHADICLLQHEFGIFGGNSGVYILPLIHRIDVPLVTVMHTVLKAPNYHEKEIIKKIGERSVKVIVMSKHAIQLLIEIYKIPMNKIIIFHHGVPDFQIVDKKDLREKYHLNHRKVLLTFGLLNRNKGIETVLHALSQVVRKHPALLYIVLGKTHPNILRETGEEYRESLLKMVHDLKLEDNVLFIKNFVSQKTLMEYLSAIDIYITPFLNEAQITSGTLSYAVGAGAAIISTPYWHARELLADGRGCLFDFNDSQKCAQIVEHLLDNPDKIEALREKTRAFGENFKWAKVGGKYLELFNQVSNQQPYHIQSNPQNRLLKLPTLSLDHVYRLTDQTGILQHAKSFVPNLKEGYCLDDNARALLMINKYYNLKKDHKAIDLMAIYLSFIHYMQQEDGSFRNFLNYEKEIVDSKCSEDVFGRTLWALGYLIRYKPKDALYQAALEIFFNAIPNITKINSVRCLATTIIGTGHFLHRLRNEKMMIKYLRDLTEKMMFKYKINRTSEWCWFEDILTYDNGILPLSLFYAYEILGDPEILNIAQESVNFLDRIVFRNKYLSSVGSNGWYKKGEQCAKYAQQPINAMALVLMYEKAYRVTKSKIYYDRMVDSFLWFIGKNELDISLYDDGTKGCCDGLESYGVNINQGAESTLSYLLAYLSIISAEDPNEKEKQYAYSQKIYQESGFN